MVTYKILTKFTKITVFASIFLVFGHISTVFAAKDSYLSKHFTVEIRKNNSGLVEQFKDWGVYKVKREYGDVCYVLSTPIAKSGNIFKRAESYFVVMNLVNDADEVMIVSGFYYKNNSDIEISFGSKKFYLLAHENKSWAYNKNDDIDIIKEMQKKDELTITAFSRENRTAIDSYSLIGFKKAYFKLKEICKK